jgi:hypothetical protein
MGLSFSRVENLAGSDQRRRSVAYRRKFRFYHHLRHCTFAIHAPNLLLFQVRNDIFRLGVYSPNKRDIGGMPAKEYCRNRQF